VKEACKASSEYEDTPRLRINFPFRWFRFSLWT
jgi:hypothetical protein